MDQVDTPVTTRTCRPRAGRRGSRAGCRARRRRRSRTASRSGGAPRPGGRAGTGAPRASRRRRARLPRCRSSRRPAGHRSPAEAITMLPASGKQHEPAQVVALTPQSDLVDVERQAAAEHRDDQARPTTTSQAATTITIRANTCPSSLPWAGEGDQGEVPGVQHQLEAEQDHQRARAATVRPGAGGEEQASAPDTR